MHLRAVVRPSVPRPALLRFSLWALFFLLGSLQAFAQSGQVNGTIKDPDQSVVSGAIVTLHNARTTTPLQTTTNDVGQYTFSAVTPGTYRLEAHKPGFVTAVVPAVIVTANQTVTQDAAFALAGTTTSVTVTGGSEGTPATGYYSENVDQGVLGTAPVVNQPFMITPTPR
jgi:iron complex outermembrane receptor protein